MIYLFILGRILLGGYFIMNGYIHFKNLESYTGYAQSKGVPMAKVSIIITGIMMLLGGLGILLGAYVQFAIFLLALFLLGTLLKIHTYWKVEDPMARMGERINFYKNLGLLGTILMLLSIPTPWVMALF